MLLQHAHTITKLLNPAIKILEKHFAFSKGGLTKAKKYKKRIKYLVHRLFYIESSLECQALQSIKVMYICYSQVPFFKLISSIRILLKAFI